MSFILRPCLCAEPTKLPIVVSVPAYLRCSWEQVFGSAEAEITFVIARGIWRTFTVFAAPLAVSCAAGEHVRTRGRLAGKSTKFCDGLVITNRSITRRTCIAVISDTRSNCLCYSEPKEGGAPPSGPGRSCAADEAPGWSSSAPSRSRACPGGWPGAKLSRLRRADMTCPRSGSPACAEPASQPSGRLSALPGRLGKRPADLGKN